MDDIFKGNYDKAHDFSMSAKLRGKWRPDSSAEAQLCLHVGFVLHFLQQLYSDCRETYVENHTEMSDAAPS